MVLIMNGGEKWRRLTKIITLIFHFKILEQFMDIFNANSWTKGAYYFHQHFPGDGVYGGKNHARRTLIVVGHETAASHKCFILTLIGLHFHFQDEIAHRYNPNRHASYHDLQNMTYVEMVTKESLRLFPKVLNSTPSDRGRRH
ncbi:uncharacterized protein LOC110834065 [Zootermopsis nevadensis]|uniref:uncharacterized protein LOC110834065 n=1 Tax=Zootermopsis nevadensis TaxID=136037 RepID=UPI000B8E7D24|nr:uncharacterized protein LOC110834065 [Zootermopsis nevadensis]